jgi:SRSO17 transposase
MNETWKSDLEAWLAPFVSALRHKTRARMCPAYIAGLIAGGERKSVQPMAARDGEVGYDQLHHSSLAALGTPRRLRRFCSLRPIGWLAQTTHG